MTSKTAWNRPQKSAYTTLGSFMSPIVPRTLRRTDQKSAKLAAVAVAIATSSVICAHAAAAAAGAAAGTQRTKLEEIIVTAERRAQNVERTPLAITAISGSMLNTLGVTRATDLNGLVPDVHIENNAGNAANIAIRGVVSENDTEVGDPAVAFNVDGVYMARPRDALTSLFDLKRIEVLRGPQGTLYGRNATAGAINVITNHPEFGRAYGRASIGFGNYNEFRTFGMANMPVSDTFGLRMAVQTDRHRGYSNNFPARPYNDLDSTAGRVEALWKPLDNLSALLTMSYYHNGGEGGDAQAPIGLYASQSGGTPYSYAVSSTGINDQTNEGMSLRVKWNLKWATVTYIGSYLSDDWHEQPGSPATGPNGGGCATATASDCQTQHRFALDHQTSDELRLSKNLQNIKWVLGLYYFREHNNVFLGITQITPIPGINVLAFHQPSVLEKSKAVFGQITYGLTDRLRLIAGARYTEDHKSRVGATEAFGSIVGDTCVNCTALYDNRANLRWHKFTWKGGLNFDVNPHTIVYATVATGYKAGGYGDGVPPNNDPYNPETITAYELGTKNMLLHHTLQVNVDVFHDLYSNYQASALAIVAGQPSTVTENAGKATIDGVELETAALLTPRDRVTFNASYLHAYFTQFYLPLGDPFNLGPVSYAGNSLPDAPHVTLRLAYQHVFPLSNGWAVVPRIDTGWRSKQNMDFHGFAVTKQGSYTRTNVTLTFQAPKSWQVMLYVRNLENKAILSSAAPDPRAITPAVGRESGFATYEPPRTFGMEISASF